jgi:hypothetical protein
VLVNLWFVLQGVWKKSSSLEKTIWFQRIDCSSLEVISWHGLSMKISAVPGIHGDCKFRTMTGRLQVPILEDLEQDVIKANSKMPQLLLYLCLQSWRHTLLEWLICLSVELSRKKKRERETQRERERENKSHNCCVTWTSW